MKMFYVITAEGLSVTYTGKKNFMVAKDHPNFKAIFDLLQSGKEPTFEEMEELADLKKQITAIDIDGVTVEEDGSGALTVKIDGKKVEILDESLQVRLVEMLHIADKDLQKAAYKAFAKFLKNLYKNPSYKSVRQLYRFLDANDLPITQNGTFLAYKKVAHDYLDIHSRSFDNSVGKVVEMPRYQVVDDPEITCASGLHVCSFDYLANYSSSELDRVVICEVNPEDVVSVPTDYHNAKMRVCKYTVVDEIPTHFEAKLGSYLYGDHAPNWMNETFAKLEKLYKDFFAVKTVEFDYLPDTISMTPAVVEAFYEEAEKVLSIPSKVKEISIEKESVPTMKVLFQWMSKYDTNWVRPTLDDETDND